MLTASFQTLEITSSGTFPLFSSSDNSSGVFSITISQGTKFTFQTAIDVSGELVNDPIYSHYTQSAQDTFEYIARLVIIVEELPEGEKIKFEYKLF